MAGFSDAAELNILKLIFTAVTWTGYAVNDTGTPQTNVGMSLHTADPGDTGTGSTSESAYTSYTRVNVVRTTSGFTCSGTAPAQAVLFANCDFPAGTGGSGTVTHFGAGASNATPPTGAQVLIVSGTVTPNIVTGNGVTPRLTTATAITLD